MSDDTLAVLGALHVDEGKLKGHVDEVVRSSVEETLNGLLDAEADHICRAQGYERSPDRVDGRADHYEYKVETEAGEVKLQVPKLRRLWFETAIIERYKRREASVEDALVETYLVGVSVRRVGDITEALWGTRVSSGTVLRLNQKVYRHVEPGAIERSPASSRTAWALRSCRNRRGLLEWTHLVSPDPRTEPLGDARKVWLFETVPECYQRVGDEVAAVALLGMASIDLTMRIRRMRLSFSKCRRLSEPA